MSYAQDNITGPDPREEDSAVREREVVVTVKIRMVQEFSNRDADDAIARKGAVLAVVDIPLLLETGHDYGLDKIAVTLASDATIRARALARPGMTVEKLAAILAWQML